MNGGTKHYCKHCNKVFYSNSKVRKYCTTECSHLHSRIQQVEWKEKNFPSERKGLKCIKLKNGMEVLNNILGVTMKQYDLITKGRSGNGY
jgi:hypothetical protein